MFPQNQKNSEKRGKSEIREMHHWLWGMDARAFVPWDSHGGMA